jgi:hypothetical protein
MYQKEPLCANLMCFDLDVKPDELLSGSSVIGGDESCLFITLPSGDWCLFVAKSLPIKADT